LPPPPLANQVGQLEVKPLILIFKHSYIVLPDDIIDLIAEYITKTKKHWGRCAAGGTEKKNG
jgi:hypothetical protein